MNASELSSMLQTIEKGTKRTNPLTRNLGKNTSPPPSHAVLKTKTVPSIPHKNKTAPYLDTMQSEEVEEAEENRYNARPPFLPTNKDLAPTSYDPKVDFTKAA
jgi:hypothetical protein